MVVNKSSPISPQHNTKKNIGGVSTNAVSLRRHIAKAIRLVIVPISKLSSLMKSPPQVGPAVLCDDPAEAYLHACIASPVFSYVSPDIYSLCDVRDRIENEQPSKPDDKP